MYHRILVPLDGSPLAEQALPYAALLARRSAAHLILVQAQEESLAGRLDPWTAVEPVNPRAAGAGATRSERELPDAAARYLDRVAAGLTDHGVTSETLLVHGSAGTAILRVAREQGADLLAMGTHGRSGIGRWLYGSVADQVLRHAGIPTLLVPPGCRRRWDRAGAGRVLVPLDGSDLAEEALVSACTLAAVLGDALFLVQAVEPPILLDSEVAGAAAVDPAELVAAAGEYLEAVATRLRERDYDVATHAQAGLAVPLLAAAAREQDVDAVAMATHGRGGLARLVLGSVATATLRHAEAPLLLVRPPVLHGGTSTHEAESYDDEGPLAPPALHLER